MECPPLAQMAAPGCPCWGCMGNHIFKRLAESGMGYIYADMLHVADELGGDIGVGGLHTWMRSGYL